MLVLIIIATMALGILIGYLLRQYDCSKVSQIGTLSVWILLFLLGIEVGGDKSIINGLHSIGFEAFIITIGGVAGSVVLSWLLWIYIKKKDR